MALDNKTPYYTNVQLEEYISKNKKKQAADKVSKKAEQKKKKSQIDDRTFGLKNKNKSKKVQGYVQSVTNSVNNSGGKEKISVCF